MRASRFLLLAVLAAGVPGLRAAAARPVDGGDPPCGAPRPDRRGPGRPERDGAGAFDERVTATLQALAPEETLRVDDWPVAPGQRAQVVLRRFDVYAPDAKIVVIEDGVETGGPPVEPALLPGRCRGSARSREPLRRLARPGYGNLRGLAMPSAGRVRPPAAGADGRAGARLAARAGFDPKGAAPSWSCGVRTTRRPLLAHGSGRIGRGGRGRPRAAPEPSRPWER